MVRANGDSLMTVMGHGCDARREPLAWAAMNNTPSPCQMAMKAPRNVSSNANGRWRRPA